MAVDEHNDVGQILLPASDSSIIQVMSLISEISCVTASLMDPTLQEVHEHVQETLRQGRRIRMIMAWSAIPLAIVSSIIYSVVGKLVENCL